MLQSLILFFFFGLVAILIVDIKLCETVSFWSVCGGAPRSLSFLACFWPFRCSFMCISEVTDTLHISQYLLGSILTGFCGGFNGAEVFSISTGVSTWPFDWIEAAAVAIEIESSKQLVNTGDPGDVEFVVSAAESGSFSFFTKDWPMKNRFVGSVSGFPLKYQIFD